MDIFTGTDALAKYMWNIYGDDGLKSYAQITRSLEITFKCI